MPALLAAIALVTLLAGASLGEALNITFDGQPNSVVTYVVFYGLGGFFAVMLVGLTARAVGHAHPQPPAPPAPPSDGTEAKPPRDPSEPEEERKFVPSTVTPAYLVGLYEGHTTVQGKKLVEPYIGKWMRVSGPLRNVSSGRPDISQVTLDKGSMFDLDHEFFATYLYFDRQRWDERLELLPPGTPIIVLGRIKEVDAADFHLEECELVEEDGEAKPPPPPLPQRKAYDVERTSIKSRGGTIKNQDVAFDAKDSDIEVEGTDIE